MESLGAMLFLGYAIALVLAVALAVIYLKGLRLKATLTEATGRLARGQKGYDELSKEYAEIKHKCDDHEEARSQLESSLGELRQRTASLELQLAKTREETKESVRKLANEKEHWEQQAQALTTQLRETIEEKKAKIKEMEAQVREGLQHAQQKQKVPEEKSGDEAKKLRSELSEKDKEAKALGSRVKRLEEVLSKVNPEEIRRVKIKAHRMEQLYNSMKGLREMADERNQNWEVALRELAAYIIKKPEVTRDKHNMQIGPLVGEALEIAGVALVHDEHVIDLATGHTEHTEHTEHPQGEGVV